MKSGIYAVALMLVGGVFLHAQTPKDGTYKGKTSDGRDIAITVKAGAITGLKLGFSLKMDKPCVRAGSGPAAVLLDVSGGETETNYSKPLPIAKGGFTASPNLGDVEAKVSGRFSGEEVKGELELRAAAGSGCSGSAKRTWAAKHTPL